MHCVPRWPLKTLETLILTRDAEKASNIGRKAVFVSGLLLFFSVIMEVVETVLVSAVVAFETFLHFVVVQSPSYFQIIHVNKFHACLDLECVFCFTFLSIVGPAKGGVKQQYAKSIKESMEKQNKV